MISNYIYFMKCSIITLEPAAVGSDYFDLPEEMKPKSEDNTGQKQRGMQTKKLKRQLSFIKHCVSCRSIY